MYKFDKFPKKIDKEEYEKQENIFISFLKENKNVISLYSIWELELLWVSDLDYLIIYKDNIDKDIINKFIKEYFLIDTILFLNINNINDINYISHHFNYKLISWKDLKISFDKNNKNLNIIYAWKICFFSLLRNFYWYKFNKKIYVKNLLSQINDIRYPIFFLRNLWINKEEYNDFITKYSEYRKKYFIHNDFKKIEYFLDIWIMLSWNIIFDLNKILYSKWKESIIYWRFPTIFKKYSSNEDYILNSEKKLFYIWKISRFLFLPVSFNYQYWDWELRKDFEKIISNNYWFLNFWFKWIKLNILLIIKKIFDFITIKLF